MLLLAKRWWLCAAAILTGARKLARRRKPKSGGAAVAALEKSALLLAKDRGRMDIERYCAAVEALLPAFSAYGRVFDKAARKDVAGNVRKLRKRAAALKKREARAMVLRERELDPAMTADPDSAARALFWINRIMQQIARSFGNLLDRPRDSFTRCATEAYVATCAPFNLPAHRMLARMMLKIIPGRDAFVAMYGCESLEELEPVLRDWIRQSAASRAAIDAFFAKHPDLAPRKRA